MLLPLQHNLRPGAGAASVGAGAANAGEPAATYEGCGSFGELALMYNCPRAATVTGGWSGGRAGGWAVGWVDATCGQVSLALGIGQRRWGHRAAVQLNPQGTRHPNVPESPSSPLLLPSSAVAALTEGVLWGVDRATFRSLVVYSMAERRQRYEATLRGMPIFRHLSQEQLAAVADCLRQEVFEVGAGGWWWLVVAGGG